MEAYELHWAAPPLEDPVMGCICFASILFLFFQ